MSYYFSIVITTFNRKDLLLKCLESLSKQQLNVVDFEVCIVDDGSTDGTASIIRDTVFQFQCKMISIRNGGPSNARNRGASEGSGKFVVFLEDDVIVHSDWLQNAYDYLKGDSIDVLEGKTIYQKSKKEVRRFDDEEYYSFIPCNLFVRRTVFMETGGYDPEFNSVKSNLYFRDDTEFGFRLMQSNVRITKSDRVIVEHPDQFSDIQSCYRHALRYQFDPLLFKKHPKKYRSAVDVKQVFGIKLHRPFHYAYIIYVIIVCSLVLSLFSIVDLETNVLLTLLVCFAFVFRIRYQGIHAMKLYKLRDTTGFFILPFVYLYGFLKGCIRYRSFGAIL